MARKERTSKGKTMRPNYFVFCEGETEVAYTEMLRGWFRLPIHIIAKNDKTYLMYDLDMAGVLERLQKVPGATLLCSNPCFELWLLLHYAMQQGALSSNTCVARLKKQVPQYRKGVLSTELHWLMEHTEEASRRAQQLKAYGNPSTNVYRLVEDLKMICMTHQH